MEDDFEVQNEWNSKERAGETTRPAPVCQGRSCAGLPSRIPAFRFFGPSSFIIHHSSFSRHGPRILDSNFSRQASGETRIPSFGQLKTHQTDSAEKPPVFENKFFLLVYKQKMDLLESVMSDFSNVAGVF